MISESAAGWLEVLSRVMNVGMLVVARNGGVEFASESSLPLLACKDRKHLQERWLELRRLLQIGNAVSGGKPRRVNVELPQAGGVRFLKLELHTPPDPGSGGCLVLMRDRHAGDALETDLLLASRMLKRLGFQVETHTNAAAALESFRRASESFDLVVTDLSMPGASGLEFARAVLAIRPDIPVVLTTGYIDPADLDIAHNIGVREVILKPTTIEEMGRAFHRLLSESPR